MLSRPVDLLFAIVEIHLPTSRTVIGGIEKSSSEREREREGERETDRQTATKGREFSPVDTGSN